MALNLFAVPPHVPFLDALARGWLAQCCQDGRDDPLTVSQGLILLPTRRSARALAEAFLRVRDGRPMLLPRITALGALDEAPLALAGALDLPPAVEPMQRLAALSKLILAMRGKGGAPQTADRAWLLARELAALMDEAERAGIDLAERLPDAADPEYAAALGADAGIPAHRDRDLAGLARRQRRHESGGAAGRVAGGAGARLGGRSP